MGAFPITNQCFTIIFKPFIWKIFAAKFGKICLNESVYLVFQERNCIVDRAQSWLSSCSNFSFTSSCCYCSNRPGNVWTLSHPFLTGPFKWIASGITSDSPHPPSTLYPPTHKLQPKYGHVSRARWRSVRWKRELEGGRLKSRGARDDTENVKKPKKGGINGRISGIWAKKKEACTERNREQGMDLPEVECPSRWYRVTGLTRLEGGGCSRQSQWVEQTFPRWAEWI